MFCYLANYKCGHFYICKFGITLSWFVACLWCEYANDKLDQKHILRRNAKLWMLVTTAHNHLDWYPQVQWRHEHVGIYHARPNSRFCLQIVYVSALTGSTSCVHFSLTDLGIL
jgi:hypothetical protein